MIEFSGPNRTAMAAYMVLEELINTLVEKGILANHEADELFRHAQGCLSAGTQVDARKAGEFIGARRSGAKWRRARRAPPDKPA